MSPEAVRILDRLGIVESARGSRRGAAPGDCKSPPPTGPGATAALPWQGIGPTAPRDSRFPAASSTTGSPWPRAGPGAELLERTTVEELLYDGGRWPAPCCAAREDGARSVPGSPSGPTGSAPWWPGAWDPASSAADPGRLRGPPRRGGGHGQSAELFFGSAGYVGLNPIGGGTTNVALVVPRTRAGEARGRAEGFFLEALRGFGQVARRIERASVVRPVLATGPFSAWSGRVTADGAALLGDAADFFDPFTGEGIYSALRGAELLAETGVRRAGAPGHRARRRARSLSPRPAAGLRRQVGRRAADRVRDALSPAVRPSRGPARSAGDWPTP